MYKIIGANQKEYGPVSAEELRRWIAEGRADATTRTQVEGTTEWVPLATIPEFAADFAKPAPPSPPPPMSGQPVYADYAPSSTNGMAIAGLVCSILGICICCCGPLFSTLGLIFSAVGLNQINSNPPQRGRELAIAGIILAVLGYLFFVLLMAHGGMRNFPRHHLYHL